LIPEPMLVPLMALALLRRRRCQNQLSLRRCASGD